MNQTALSRKPRHPLSSTLAFDDEGLVPQLKHCLKRDRLGDWLNSQLGSYPVVHHRPGFVLVIFVELDVDRFLDEPRLETAGSPTREFLPVDP